MSTTNSESKALEYIRTKGWNYREGGGDQIQLEICPYCSKDNFHLYMAIGGNKDGLHDCKVCGESGNLRRLMEENGDRVAGVTAFKELGKKEKEALPDYQRAHAALLEDADALSYLEDVRGYTLDVIKRMKLGLTKRWFPELKYEARALLIPYLVGENIVFAKYRSLPPADKAFDGLRGYEASLFNEAAVLQPGLKELVMVEGEGDTLSLLSNGVDGAVGVPGANVKKAAWIAKLDKIQPEKIYLLYDNDPVGQKAAYEMAVRIGINKVFNILLPEFLVEDPEAEDGFRKGKDINEWFQAGHTLEDFEVLKRQAERFGVAGVTNLEDALERVIDEIDAKDGKLMAEFRTPWPSVNKYFGGADRGDLVMVLAEEKRGKTTWCLNWLDDLVAQGHSSMLYCLEMPEHRLARKWCSMVTETDDSPAQSEEEAVLRGKAMKQAIAEAKLLMRERAADLLFGYTKDVDVDTVFDTIRQAVRRYGLTVVCFDNLQALADVTLKNEAFRTTHLSKLSKRFKQLAMELNILIVLIVQPNRIRENQIADANNADGASQIQKDCDSFITMHRNAMAKTTAEDFQAMGSFMDEEMSFEPQTLIRIARSRYAGGGQTTLWFYGNISKFVEFTEHQLREAEKERKSNEVVVTNGAVPTEEIPQEVGI